MFQELEARTRELARSVGELKALGEVGQAVSSTLDLETVLSTIVWPGGPALAEPTAAAIYEYDEPTQEFHLRASYQMEEELVTGLRANPARTRRRGYGSSGGNENASTDCNTCEEQELRYQRDAAHLLDAWLSIAAWRCRFFAKSRSWAGLTVLSARNRGASPRKS